MKIVVVLLWQDWKDLLSCELFPVCRCVRLGRWATTGRSESSSLSRHRLHHQHPPARPPLSNRCILLHSSETARSFPNYPRINPKLQSVCSKSIHRPDPPLPLNTAQVLSYLPQNYSKQENFFFRFRHVLLKTWSDPNMFPKCSKTKVPKTAACVR